MRLTNKQNLPESFIRSYESHEPVENRYSVTELLNPTREIVLTRKHWNDLEEDVADTISALFGTAVHHILELKGTEQTEVKIEFPFANVVIVGRVDVMTDKSIEDYKTAKVAKVTKQDFDDYYKQGMLYALGRLIRDKIKTEKLKFYIMLKDWSKMKVTFGGNYPSSPIYVWEYDIKDSDYDYIISWLTDKLNSIRNFNDDKCSDDEKWYTGTKYAVYKNVGDKKATYVTDDETDAHNYITNKLNGSGEIEVRKGENLKCKYYCPLGKICKEE